MADTDHYSPAETKRRMEDGLRRALTTPHKPHAKLIKGKAGAAGKRKATARKKRVKRS